MTGSILDTNIITKMIDEDPVAVSIIKKIEIFYTSVIVAGELYFAAAKSARREANLVVFKTILSGLKIIPIDEKVCMSYADIKLDLKKKGMPIPENDIWIAACAYTHGLSVATLDNHFSEITQIELVRPD
jgi:tRNA(fMet)-specific endonuclease VapC